MVGVGRDHLLYLSREDVRALLPSIDDQIALAETVFRAMATGRVEMPAKTGVHPRPDAFIHSLPAYLADDDLVSVKWVSGYPANRSRGLPYISGLIIVSDAATGVPVAVMDGTAITSARTAAASGVCARHFAPADWRTVALIGCGEQGTAHARTLAALNSTAVIRVYDETGATLEALQCETVTCDSAEAALEGSEIIVTATPTSSSPRPTLTSSSLGDRFLGLPVDLDAFFAPDAILDADVLLVDDEAQFHEYQSVGRFKGWPIPRETVGEALSAGRRGGRIVCCNIGIGALDTAFAACVLTNARIACLGRTLPL
jgi:ornithine cyclodeaminase/alanine dehydrogenase